MPAIICNEDLRQLARRRAPRAIFDYVDRGSYDEATIRANRADFDALKLRQRVMIDVDKRSTATTMLCDIRHLPRRTGRTPSVVGGGAERNPGGQSLRRRT